MALVQPAMASLPRENGTGQITLASMSTAAFLGETSQGPLLEPVTITSVRAYREHFGDARAGAYLADAVAGFFANGGTKAVVCNLGESSSAADRLSHLAAGLQRLELVAEPALVCAPGRTDMASQELLLTHCEAMRDRMALLDGPADLDLGGVTNLPRPRDSAFGAYYFPWVYVYESGWGARCVPPSGHIAGLLARVDAERGVHRTSSNEILRGAIGVRQPISRADQEFLNPRGVNCVRDLGDRGIRLYGSSTIASEPMWRPLSTRRLAAMIERSVTAGLLRVTAGCPIDDVVGVCATEVQRFLHGMLESGMFAGSTDEEAFATQCSLTGVGESYRLTCHLRFAPVTAGQFVPMSVSIPVPTRVEFPPEAQERAG